MRTGSRTLAVILGFLALALLPAAAQDVGDRVVPKAPVDLKVKDAVVESVDADDVLTVERIQDKWLWVKTEAGTKGWVKADSVKPYEENAPASPDGEAPDSPEQPLEPEADRLYLIGALGGAHVYTTYAYIGVLADGLSKELYKPEQTTELLNEIVSVSDSLIKNLGRVRDGGVSPADTTAINNMIDIYKLLQDEAKAAIAFTGSRTPEDAEKFDAARKAAWPKIADLLGLEKTEEP
ncbi:MAG: hypothetical protein U0992_15735 [Planctomycetaceae bacterium]